MTPLAWQDRDRLLDTLSPSAWRVLQQLADGDGLGRIEARRRFPHRHHYHVRSSDGAELPKEVPESAVAELVAACLLEVRPCGTPVVTDAIDYPVSDRGRALLAHANRLTTR